MIKVVIVMGLTGKEKDDEVYGEGSSYDFGARFYNPRVGRWLSLDPMAADAAGVTPYNYCFNNPLIYSDPDGKYPIIVITTEVTGHTVQKAYGGGSVRILVVPTYKAIVYDYNEQTGEKHAVSSVNVTRDGYYNHGVSELSSSNDYVSNKSSEPAEENVTVSAKGTIGYAYGTSGAIALGSFDAEPFNPKYNYCTPKSSVLSSNGKEPIDPLAVRDNPYIAKGVMLHVGGYYVNKDKEHKIAGTYGCYGVVAPDQVFQTREEAKKFARKAYKIYKNGTGTNEVTPSNYEMQKLLNLIDKARENANERGDSNPNKTEVTINKRKGVVKFRSVERSEDNGSGK